ncbi:DUF202 domain-containing protein [Streptomyces sp. NPDC005355]|uniref:DUF202 domain-containing protein n=1 Tax=unclassified Streptomyces TaxID=2593676 RepID=UPI00339E6387
MPEGNGTNGTRTRDPGLQPERTRLAWRRTTLACAVAASLAGRQTLHTVGVGPVSLLALALVVLAWLAFLAVAHRRIRALHVPRPPALSPRAAVVSVACVMAVAVFGAVTLR